MADEDGAGVQRIRIRPAGLRGEAGAHDSWAIDPIDPITGELIDDEEMRYRRRIVQEYEEGFTAIDRLYQQSRDAIHQPLADEHGGVIEDAWQLERARTLLRIPIDALGIATTGEDEHERIQRIALQIAHTTGGPIAAKVMQHLYEIANNPPHWRRNEITIRLTDLLDRLGYTRDERGVHRSKNRRTVSKALLALHLTHIGIQRSGGGESIGFIAPLIADLAYATRESVADLTPIEVFEKGLPDRIAVTISKRWYTLRYANGNPVDDYVLLPIDSRPQGSARGRRGVAATPLNRLRQYITSTRERSPSSTLPVTRAVLIERAGITDRNASQATKTLRRNLERLVMEGTLLSFGPDPLPLDGAGRITLVHKDDAPPT
jgi:hypothetical protein